MQPVTIKLFLVDGKPEGIRTAEISNWTGKAIAGPRSELSDLLKREELVGAGIYLLTGANPDTDMPTVYIGEAESVVKRLKDHRKRDDWSHVVAFVSKDENLTKAHIRYLEGQLIQLANTSSRAFIQNNASSGAKLPESDKAEMDIYLEKLLQLLPILGIDIFKTISAPTGEQDDLLYCRIKGIEARGNRTAEGFVVYKGSQAVVEHRPSSVNFRAKRIMLLKQGYLEKNGNALIFTKDMEFGSPSTAAAVVRGGNSNGLKCWKNSAGLSLKELEENV
jgi:hypothetical protein